MKNSYSKQLVVAVNREDEVAGEVERWQVHRQGILHRGFTVALLFNNKLILQHRKHPAFDGYFDLSFSSHQLFIDGHLQSSHEAIDAALRREWDIRREDLLDKIEHKGNFIYRAQDPKSKFIEHEIDYFYLAKINHLPTVNYDFAYGYYLIDRKRLTNDSSPLFKALAPWAKIIIKKKFI